MGPFSALFRAPAGMNDPVLVASADGVGTKVLIARLLGVYDTVGQDLVNHCVNDILTAGRSHCSSSAIWRTTAWWESHKVALVAGVSRACTENGCALIGGETADMPDVYRPGDFDLAGFIVGVVRRARVIDGRGITAGDALVALPRKPACTRAATRWCDVSGGWAAVTAMSSSARLEAYEPDLGTTLGQALLAVHRSYLPALRPVLDRIKGFAHITGGGLLDNVPRILPDGLTARFATGSLGNAHYSA
ncbi:MAG: phosphoribosylformylglycinamidine cyclo-ligase [Dehalococcoidia bacterium]